MFLYSPSMTNETKSPFRCFDRRYLLRTLMLGAVLIGLAALGRLWSDGTPMKIAIAITEAILFACLIGYTLLALRRLDELQQRIHLIAIAVSFGTAGAIAGTAEYLEGAGVAVPAIGLWLWMVMLAVWVVSAVVLARRYR